MKVIDPVCGTGFDRDAAGAIEECEGRPFYFCSEHCREAFMADPAKYAASGVQGEHEICACDHHGKRAGHSGGGHGCCR